MSGHKWGEYCATRTHNNEFRKFESFFDFVLIAEGRPKGGGINSVHGGGSMLMSFLSYNEHFAAAVLTTDFFLVGRYFWIDKIERKT